MNRLGAFGPIVFEVSEERILTFDHMRAGRRGRYSTLNVADHEQLLHYEGKELSRLDFSIQLHHRFCDPMAEIDRMYEMVEAHEAYPMIVGGRVLGEFVLEEVGDNWRRVADNGVLMMVECDLRLWEYK
ncbi:MAG: phage tail protein [Desulfobulbaceae bacterium]|jgi:hypothetical protein|nr:phage tail protein [Desulfobulbaceae bacterium]